MPGPASRLTQTMRWLPFVVAVGLAGPVSPGWGSAVTVLAQAGSEDQQPADMSPLPTVDDSPTVLDQTPAGVAVPVPEDVQPASDDPPSSQQPQPSDVQLCVTVTSASSSKFTVVAQTWPPDAP